MSRIALREAQSKRFHKLRGAEPLDLDRAAEGRMDASSCSIPWTQESTRILVEDCSRMRRRKRGTVLPVACVCVGVGMVLLGLNWGWIERASISRTSLTAISQAIEHASTLLPLSGSANPPITQINAIQARDSAANPPTTVLVVDPTAVAPTAAPTAAPTTHRTVPPTAAPTEMPSIASTGTPAIASERTTSPPATPNPKLPPTPNTSPKAREVLESLAWTTPARVIAVADGTQTLTAAKCDILMNEPSGKFNGMWHPKGWYWKDPNEASCWGDGVQVCVS